MQRSNSNSTVTSNCDPVTVRAEEILSENKVNIYYDCKNKNDEESSFHKSLDDPFKLECEESSSVNRRNNLSRQQSDCNSEPLPDQPQDCSEILGFGKLSIEKDTGDRVTSEAVALLSENVTSTQQTECESESSPDQPQDGAVKSEFDETLLENEVTTLNSQQNKEDPVSSSKQLPDDPERSGCVKLSAETNTNITSAQLKYRDLNSLSHQTQRVTTTSGLGIENKTNTLVSQQSTSFPRQSSARDSTHIRHFIINKSDSESASSCCSTSSVTDELHTEIKTDDTQSSTSSVHHPSLGDSRYSSRNKLNTILNKSCSESTLSCDLHQSSLRGSRRSVRRQCNVINTSDRDTSATSYSHQSSPGSFRDSTLEPCYTRASFHYLHADSMRTSDGSTGTHLLASLVDGGGRVDYGDMSIQEMVHGLTRPDWHMHHASLREALLLERLPSALETRNMADAAECLTACDPDVQDRAVSCLEQLLLVDRQKYNSAQDLSTVMGATMLAIHRHHGNTTHLLHHIYLFLLAACELLRTPQLPPDVQRSIELVKAKFCSILKDCACPGSNKASSKLQVIRQIFAAMTQAGFPETCQHVIHEWREQVFAKRKNTDQKLKQATFPHLLLYFHSLILEMNEIGWSPAIRKLAGEINHIFREMCRRKMKENIGLSFDIFAIRCLSLVLKTTFNEERQNLPGRSSDSPRMLVTLISDLVLKSDNKKILLEELVGLHFHPCCEVRLFITDSMTQCHLELEETILKYIDTRVRLTGIKVCCDFSPEDKIKKAPKTCCTWVEKKCLGDAGVKLVVAFYLPRPSCLGRGPITNCMEQHSDVHQLYNQNLKMLQNVKTHPNFLTLHAFQIHPMPSFYITEDVSESRLLHLLLDRRSTKRWLPSNILSEAALDVASALEFLDEQRIVLRDITTYNMTSHIQERRASQNGGDITFIRVKVADLGLACSSSLESDYDNRNIVKSTVIDAGPVPTRWTSVEALCYGEFSSKSMVYALGYVLYELFTHGCQPFSEMQGRSTEDILKLVVLTPECTRPFRWACFPPEIFDLMRSCTTQTAADRPSFPHIQQKLKASLQSRGSYKLKVEVPSCEQPWQKDQDYPLLDLQQVKRCHVPERGIPSSMRNLKVDQTRYKNLLPDYWKLQKDKKDEDYSIDPIIIKTEEDGSTSVCEVLMPTFVETVLPVLQTSTLDSVLPWKHTQIYLHCDHISQERSYGPAVTLADAIKMHLLTLPGDEDEGLHVHTFIAIAKCVRQLHQENWIHRDLKAANILITRDTGKVILVRIGRMVHLAEREFIREKEMVFTDSLRWLSPEALHLSVYTKENDIFMLGTTIWETYNIRQVCSRNPAAAKSDLVPFPNKTKEEVVRLIQEGVHLPKVPDMPEWLYKLVLDCRLPDKEERPNISDLITRLEERFCKCLSTEASVSAHGTRVIQTDAGSHPESGLSTHKDDIIEKSTKKSTFIIFCDIFKKKHTKCESTKTKLERTSVPVDDYADLGDVCSVMFQYEENWSENKPTDSHSRSIVSPRSLVPQEVTAARKVIKHRRDDQLLPPLPLVTACNSLAGNFAQNSDDRKNRKVSSWGDEVSPLHLKNTDRLRQRDEEDDSKGDKFSNCRFSSVSRSVVPQPLSTADIGDHQEEYPYEDSGSCRKRGYLRPVPDDWLDKHIYVNLSQLPLITAADHADQPVDDGYKKSTGHEKPDYLTPVPDDWWDKHPALTLSRSSSS